MLLVDFEGVSVSTPAAAAMTASPLVQPAGVIPSSFRRRDISPALPVRITTVLSAALSTTLL